MTTKQLIIELCAKTNRLYRESGETSHVEFVCGWHDAEPFGTIGELFDARIFLNERLILKQQHLTDVFETPFKEAIEENTLSKMLVQAFAMGINACATTIPDSLNLQPIHCP